MEGALDPEVAAVLRFMSAAENGGPPAHEVPVALARRGHEAESVALSGPGEPVASVGDERVPSAGWDVPVRVYTPADAGPGLVVYLHGGGWATGSIDSFDTVARALANAAGQPVVSVGYRLAPEHPFPAGLEDALAVARWAVGRAGDPALVAVAGDSSGGNLAAVVARRLRDDGIRLGFQLLIYPVTDAACSTPSYRDFGEGFGLSAAGMQRWWNLYLDGAGGLAADVSPLRVDDLSGLPPAWVLVAGHDVLRDEGVAYAERLSAAGVPVQLVRYDGCVHGFWRWLARCHVAREANARAGAALRAALADPAPAQTAATTPDSST